MKPHWEASLAHLARGLALRLGLHDAAAPDGQPAHVLVLETPGDVGLHARVLRRVLDLQVEEEVQVPPAKDGEA